MLYDIGFYLYKTPRAAQCPVMTVDAERLRVCHTRAL